MARAVAGSLAASRAGRLGSQDVEQLMRAMGESGERAAGWTVAEIELDLDDPATGANGVDGHPGLHAEAGGEGKHVAECGLREGPLTADGRPHLKPAAPADGAARESDRKTEPSPHAPGEDRDGHVGSTAPDRCGKLLERASRLAEIAVAEDKY